MTARVITDYYGSSIAVPDTCPNQFGDGGANSHVVLFTAARGAASTTHYLTRAQSDELIDALIARNQEIDAAALTSPNPRPSASPVAEGRATAAGPSTPTAGPGRPINPIGPSPCAVCGTQDHTERFHETAPVGAGAAPTEVEDTSLSATGGDVRTQAAGLGNPTAEPGRPTCEHGYRFENALCPIETCGASAYVEPGRPTLASMLGNARGELLANSTLIGPAGGEVR